jgi:hypothetical protein
MTGDVVPQVIRPVENPDDAFFWEKAREGKLAVRQCAKCSRLQHPPSPMCPVCGSVDWVVRELSGRGTIYSWIVSRHPSEPDDAPRIVVLVQLEEGPRLVSNLQGVEVADVVNDMPVVVTFEEVDGVTLPRFRPANAAPSRRAEVAR